VLLAFNYQLLLGYSG